MFKVWDSKILKHCHCSNCKEYEDNMTQISINGNVQVMCNNCWKELIEFIEREV